MHIHTHCPDGTDRHCATTVPVALPYSGLSPDDVQENWIETDGQSRLHSVDIWPPQPPEWLTANEPWLSDTDLASIESEGHFRIEHDDLPSHNCCAACGSSETYDDDGNNITAL